MKDKLIVSTDWLETNLDSDGLCIVDIRGHVTDTAEGDSNSHYADYTDGHILGAVFVDWINEICDDPQHLRIAGVEKFSRAMSRIGVSSDVQVVAYDDASSVLAARLWWSLNYYGHTNVAILDGGWQKWRSEQRPVSTDMPQFESANFDPRPDKSLLRQGNEVLHSLHSDTVLLDVRTEEEYRGQATLADLRGHIPGAVNLPAHELTATDGTLLEPDDLRKRFAAVGIDGSEPEVIIYSNVGMAACLALLAMRAAGFTNGTVYDTSWQEWGNDTRKPVEQM